MRLTSEDTSTLEDWVSAGVAEKIIQAQLNNTLTKKEGEYIKKLLSILRRAEKFIGVTFRGIGFETEEELNKFLSQLTTGDTWTASSFLSTSKDKFTAAGFSITGPKSILLKISGRSGVFLDPYVEREFPEKEVLFPPGVVFKVKNTKNYDVNVGFGQRKKMSVVELVEL